MDSLAESAKKKKIPGYSPRSDMEMYLVTLNDILTDQSVDIWEQSSSNVNRAKQYNSGFSRTSSFLNDLKCELKRNGLDKQVGSFGEPTTLPMVWLECTAYVADFIRGISEVKSVVKDQRG